MEPSNGFEKRDGKLVPRRPRSCSNEETDGGDNACACYILNIAGQNGYKVITLIRKMTSDDYSCETLPLAEILLTPLHQAVTRSCT